MNRIDFTNNGGFRATQKTWKFVQDNYLDVLKGIAALCGDKTIISGVVVVDNSVSDGWISYNGELIRFVGGLTAAGVVVDEVSEAINFEDGNPHDTYFVKTATCGSPATFPFSDLKRLNTLRQMWLPGDVKTVNCNDAYILANFDMTPGSPTLGLGKNERLGWAICNGVNGTLNMGGRVVTGYSTVTVDPVDGIWDELYNTIGGTGGQKGFVVTENNIEKFSIDKPGSSGTGGIGNPVAGNGSDDGNVTYDVGVDNPTKIDNRSPFIVSLFIQKL